jgi:glycosyltransferase involved in cell wall biosynthesis
MVCPPKGFKVDLDNQPLTMTTRLLPTADAFAHKSAHYRLEVLRKASRKRFQEMFTWEQVLLQYEALLTKSLP